MTQPFRLPALGLIDRSRVIRFRFDGQEMTGHPGDTLASALLANGQHFVARSIKYHRPRGIISAGLEEPSALITVVRGEGKVPNLKVTEVLLTDGLVATSQNAWPSLRRDAGALIGLAGRMLGAGFYYKTFMWPKEAWHRHYETLLRRVAGHGRADPSADAGLYDKRRIFCDILVIGSGPAGLSAALTAARGGATTVIVEAAPELGGTLLWDGGTIAGATAQDWAKDARAELATLSNVTTLLGTLAFGQYDHGLVLAVQTNGADDPTSAISWKIRACRIILASGEIERPAVFSGNDRPGVMLAASVRQYIHRYGVAPGRRAVVAVADQAEREATLQALKAAGIKIAAVLDPSDTLLAASGRHHLRAVRLRRATGRRERIACDLLCVSAGWMPSAHLFAQMGGTLGFDAKSGCLLPQDHNGPLRVAGAARGARGLADCLGDGKALAHRAMGELELHRPMVLPLAAVSQQAQMSAAGGRKAFVDLQNDVIRDDLFQAVREGYGNVELAKRYTMLGMGTDQGKTSWTNGLLTLAEALDTPTADIGHTTYRAPYSPVTIGALVGAETGQSMAPTRRTPFHDAFAKAGAVFQTSGDWLYPRYCPQPGEDMTAAITREVRAVRDGLGCTDMSTLGKIEVRGTDALTFLSRLYCNNLSALVPGRLRYGLMLREDGIAFDDGVIACLGADHYLATATTARAESVWRHMQKLGQIDWPELDVTLTQVSDHWASLAIAGPQARNLLAALAPDFATGRDDFPFAAVREGLLGGDLPVRVFSVSFSGELSYEINVPAGFAPHLWQRVLHEGAAWNITPYGLEALDVLRIEKGHLSVGTEIDGRRTADDLGLGKMVSTKKDFIGRALLGRPALVAKGRGQLIGLRPIDGKSAIPAAAHLAAQRLADGALAQSQGYLTAAVASPTLGHPLALAFLANGRARIGERLWAVSPIAGVSTEVEVTSACAYDPKGERLHG